MAVNCVSNDVRSDMQKHRCAWVADLRRPALRWVAIQVPASVLLLLMLMDAAGCSPGHVQGHRSAEPPAPVSALTLAHRTATEFMDDMVASRFRTQWELLSEVAKAQWPWESARAKMLQGKFNGPAKVASFTLGPTRSGAVWTSGESPDHAISAGLFDPDLH